MIHSIIGRISEYIFVETISVQMKIIKKNSCKILRVIEEKISGMISRFSLSEIGITDNFFFEIGFCSNKI